MKRAVLAILLFSLIFLLTAPAALPQDGKTLYRIKFCVVCHGPSGFSVDPNYPTLAKQNQLYLINQMNDILAKKRTNKFTLLMTEHPIVSHVTPDEISSIARYLHSHLLAGERQRSQEANQLK